MAAVIFPPEMPRDVAYNIGRELMDEWLDANLPLIKHSVYTQRGQLRVVRELGAGYLLAKLCQDESTAYLRLADFLTGQNHPKRTLL